MAGEIRVAVDILGCKLNQAEGELLVRKLIPAGYRVVAADSAADAYILNTCTVTHIADRKARQALRAFKRRSPDALIIATGCYAERARDELSTIPGVRYVLGNREKARVLEILDDFRGAARPPEEREQIPPGATRPRLYQDSGRLRELLHLLHCAAGTGRRDEPADREHYISDKRAGSRRLQRGHPYRD